MEIALQGHFRGRRGVPRRRRDTPAIAHDVHVTPSTSPTLSSTFFYPTVTSTPFPGPLMMATRQFVAASRYNFLCYDLTMLAVTKVSFDNVYNGKTSQRGWFKGGN
jgi:hypothetical protein